MAEITANKTLTFTITKTPRLDKHRKTLQRLIYMQRHIQKGLRDLSKRRAREDNITSPRAGRTWTNRARMTKFQHPVQGESFRIFVSQQILADVKSIEKFVSVKA